MTNLEALKSTPGIPEIDENKFIRLLLDRGLDGNSTYTGKAVNPDEFKSFQLAKADLYVELITTANISEGGFSLSVAERSNFLKVAQGIYDQYGEQNPLSAAGPTVENIQVW